MKYLVFGGDGLQDGRVTFYREKRADGGPGAELQAYAPTTSPVVQPDGTIKQVRGEGTAVPLDKVYEPGEFILRKMAEVREIADGTKPGAPVIPAVSVRARAEVLGSAARAVAEDDE